MRQSPLSPHGTSSLASAFQQDLLAERTGIRSRSRVLRSTNLSPCKSISYLFCDFIVSSLLCALCSAEMITYLGCRSVLHLLY